MKLSIFIVFLIGMAGCTSPQSPVVKETTIAGLSIPDTIDFGVVRAGLSKTLSVTFENTGSDSLHITSQTISDSFFQEDPRWKQFNIAPDSSQIANITYIPHDSIDVAYDTLRSGNKVNIIQLRGKEIQYASEGLVLPSTIDFGVVRLGLSKDSNISFQNIGSDTLKVTSHSFSNSKFKLVRASQGQMIIAPGTSQTVGIQFSPTDTSSIVCYDTIRTLNKTYILMFSGNSEPFSSFFPTAPIYATLSLTGLIGKDENGSIGDFSFSFQGNFNGALSSKNNWIFSYYNEDEYVDGRGDVIYDKITNSAISLQVDSSLGIDTIIATYSYYNQPRGANLEQADEGLNLRVGVKLVKDSIGYSSLLTGATINAIVAGANYNSNLSGSYGTLESIIGYEPTAKLSISIQ